MLNRMFVKALIKKKENVFIVEAVYSWLGLYHYTEVDVFSTLQEANNYLLDCRCSGHLRYDIEPNKEDETP